MRRLVAIGALVVGGACSCPKTSVLVSDFEGCTGTCGWTVTGGAASIVSTILPGEHGLKLAGGATATHTVSAAMIDNSYSLSLVGSCPDGLAATLMASAPGKGDVELMVTLALDTSLDTNGNPPSYTGASYVPLVGAIVLPTGLTSATVHQLTLAPATGSDCTIDIVRLTKTEPCNG